MFLTCPISPVPWDDHQLVSISNRAFNYILKVILIRIIKYVPLDATKFFGCELGAQVKCDEKNDRYIVNGAHEAAKLQELLDAFIKKFVLCGECNNPETDLVGSIVFKSNEIG